MKVIRLSKGIEKLANSEKVINLAISILGSKPEIVRVVYFDKTPNKNWLVSGVASR